MRNHLISRINILIILAAAAVIFAAASSAVSAASVPGASGYIDSGDGAVLRKSASVSSKRITVLGDGTRVKIYKEVFKSKTSASAKKKWYYIKAGGKKGYVRSDLVSDVSYGTVSGKTRTSVNYRRGAGIRMKKSGRFKKNRKIEVCLVATPVYSTRGTSKKWYKLRSGSNYYYVCSSKVKLSSKKTPAPAPYTDSSPSVNMSDSEFEAYMTSQGFPETYKSRLRALHRAHPNWGFIAYNTGIRWSDAVTKESKKGVSLIHKSYPSSYRNGSSQPESGWYNANSKAVAYYLDPRNFINEKSIYMFEDLSYKPLYQTEGVVNAILAPSKLPSCGFTGRIFVNAGAKNNVSPVFLAARARQESGSGGNAVNGKSSLGKVYNPFNIGAFGGTNPLYNGLIYAKAKGWNTPAKAVEGGAKELAKNYINKGQHTVYYQRFNVRNGAGNVASHQYMTNITAPYTEALQTRASYNEYGVTKQPIVFEIPVYGSMPSSTELP